jgi:hypothetical protein
MQRIVQALFPDSASIPIGRSLVDLPIYTTARKALAMLSMSLSLILLAVWAPQVNADDFLNPAFFNNLPLSLQTQNATDIAIQRHFGGPRDAGLIGSVCSACLLSGFQGGRNALAAMGLSQLGVTFPGLDSLSGGSQFFGQAPPPQTFSTTFQDPFAAGGAFTPAINNAFRILGFGTGSTSPSNFGSTFLLNSDPVFSGGFGFGGFAGFGQSLAPVTSGATPQAVSMPQAPALSPVEFRYLTLAQHQVDVLYTDDTLSALRAEFNANQLLFLYNDPLYSYWSYELTVLLQQIVTTRPAYAFAVALAQEIAAYTAPPDDNTILEGRYSQRLALAALNAQVDFEARAFLAENPLVAGQVADVAFLQMQSVQQIFSSPQAIAYGSDWSTRFQTAMVNSPGFPSLALELEQIFLDFPAFREYLQLNQEIISLLPLFNEHPLVLQVQSLATSVNADPTVAQSIAVFYQQFTNEVDELLRHTTYKAEVERSYEQLNGLIEADPTYRLLRDTQFLTVLTLDGLQRQIHDAVANCMAIFGQSCDPYSDPQVLALLPAFNVDSFNLLVTVGQFYELYNRFLYGFSHSQAFLSLQTEALARVQASLVEILPNLLAAQERFDQNVNNIPQVSAVQNAIVSLGLTLRSESIELDTRLNRMAELFLVLSGQ